MGFFLLVTLETSHALAPPFSLSKKSGHVEAHGGATGTWIVNWLK